MFGGEFCCRNEEDDFEVLSCYWHYTEHRHRAQSQPGQLQYVNGCAGKLYLKGSFAGLLPGLVLASELHLGNTLPNAQGYLRLHTTPVPSFDMFFPHKKGILAAVRDVLHRYDHALESLSLSEQYPFNEEAFADNLLRQLVTGTYLPAPNTAFLVRKRGGAERLVEQLGLRDLILQQYLLSFLSKPFDQLFEESSIGFRRGRSRLVVVEMVQAALAEGYQYVVESDIEDFFPTVDLRMLEGLLDRVLPTADHRLKVLLGQLLRSSYVLKGELHERTQGLAQGAPLSPLLANLYLDAFDEQAREWPVRLIRYADDCVPRRH